MTGFEDPQFYGDRWAAVYDELHLDLDPEPAARLLVELAGRAPALELGIGTGRVALVLADRGVDVAGVDASAAIVAKLRAKPGGDRIPVSIGDLVDTPATGRFGLVYLVFNTLFCLLDEAKQAACFAHVATLLADGGRFVLECFVPDPARFDRGQRPHVLAVSEDSVSVELSRHDPVAQRITTQILTIDADGIRLGPLALRYSWPDELDRMAERAGLRLEHRYGDWDRRPFEAASAKHVSVYRLA
ncbi:MAG: class I SAM-dependent DNA methyltransferase [Jatrophihabitans sp.]